MTRSEQEKLLLLLNEKEKRECEKSYYKFFLHFWDILEPQTPLKNNFHIKYLCDLLQYEVERIAARKKKSYDIVINIPPRTLKSSIASKFLNPWAWTRYPHLRFVGASYSEALVLEHALASRRIISSERYKRHWDDWKLTSDQNVKSYFENSCSGYRMSIPVGVGTGKGGNIFSIDDPLDATKRSSPTEIKSHLNWFNETASTRLNDPKVDIYLIIMQRICEEDLTGHVLSVDGSNYFHVCLPGEFSEDIKPKELAKEYKNGLFCEDILDHSVLKRYKIKLQDYGYAGQIQQRPAPQEGGMFKRADIRYWKPAHSSYGPVNVRTGDQYLKIEPIDLPKSFDDKINSWDFAFKGEDHHDNVSGLTLCKNGGAVFLTDRIEGHFDFTESRDKTIELKNRDTGISTVLIEDKANGPAIMNSLEKVLSGITPVSADRSTGGKIARARAVVPVCKDGLFYVPHPEYKPWVEDFINNLVNFPNAKRKGDVDSLSQAVDYFLNNNRVLNSYSSLNEKHYSDFGVDLDVLQMRGFDLLSTVYLERNLVMSVLFSIFDRREQRLFVVKERELKNPLIDDIVEMFSSYNQKPKIYLTKDLFVEDKSVSKILRKEGIRTAELPSSDQWGAIFLANRMFSKNQISVHEKCYDLDSQLMRWNLVKDEPVKHGFGLARCLLYTLMVLRGEIQVKEDEPQKGYVRESELQDISTIEKTQYLPERGVKSWLAV